MPDGMPPALVVERFDILRRVEDQRRFAMETSVRSWICRPRGNITAPSNHAERAKVAIDRPTADLDILYRRAVFAWLIADGDMHLKNLAMLKIAEAGATAFTLVRFAPLYDAVTTRVFPGLGTDRLT
jgi:serine/threonine-protein kinase HipA